MALTPNRVRTMLTTVGCPSMPYPWIYSEPGGLYRPLVPAYDLLRRICWASGAIQHSADAVWQSMQDDPDHYGTDSALTEAQLDNFCRLVARELK